MKKLSIFFMIMMIFFPISKAQTILAASFSQIGPDGYFYLNGEKTKTIVVGVEEERRVLSKAQVDELIPRLKDTGINFLVIYFQNLQNDYFYKRMEEKGIWIAQHLGTVKKELQGFSNTGGVIGTVPDEAWFQARLADVNKAVTRLASRTNILFWWMGGEFVEPDFYTPSGTATIRDHISRYRDAIQALDPMGRPFTVSHHYIEAIENPLAPFIDFSDLTDFTWFTVATHFHLGDFIPCAGWWPIAQVTEPRFVLNTVLQRAYNLNHQKPIFFGGWYGQAPFWGPCTSDDQGDRMLDKWAAISNVPNIGYSTYHLDEWDGNGIPHALFKWTGNTWVTTAAGNALREIATSVAMENGVTKSGLAGVRGAELRFLLDVPKGATNLKFTMSGGTGDADLYVRKNSPSTTSTYDCRPFRAGNGESCSFINPDAGPWYVMVRGYNNFSGVSLVGSHNISINSSCPSILCPFTSFQIFSAPMPAMTNSLYFFSDCLLFDPNCPNTQSIVKPGCGFSFPAVPR